MINLLAKLDFNGSAFNRGLSNAVQQAKGAGGKMASVVGTEFTSKLKSYLGVGAAIGAVVAGFRSAQEIRDQAAALGVTTQEMAAMELVAKRLGDTSNVTTDEFMRLVDEVIFSGQVPKDSVLTRMADDADHASEAIRKLGALVFSLLGTWSRAFNSTVSGIQAAAKFPDGMESPLATYKRYREGFLKEWRGTGAGTSIAERAIRTDRPSEEKESRAKAEATVKAEREERRKVGLANGPLGPISRGLAGDPIAGGSLTGPQALQRQILAELRRVRVASERSASKIEEGL